MLEQVCWLDLWSPEGPMVEHPFPKELHPMEGGTRSRSHELLSGSCAGCATALASVTCKQGRHGQGTLLCLSPNRRHASILQPVREVCVHLPCLLLLLHRINALELGLVLEIFPCFSQKKVRVGKMSIYWVSMGHPGRAVVTQPPAFLYNPLQALSLALCCGVLWALREMGRRIQRD